MTTGPTPETRSRPHGAPPTLVEVAARAGVSLKTASRAVNGEPRVADQTRKKVLDAAHELGFQLNRAASMLARGVASNALGLITGDLANPFYSALAKGVEHELRARGMQLIVASSDEDPDRERSIVNELVNRQQVRALVIVSTLDDHSAMQAVQSRGTPLVFVDRRGVGIEADSVIADNRNGSRLAVQHLIDGGHTKIAYIGDIARLETHRERLLGYKDAMDAAGLDSSRWVRTGAHSLTAANETAQKMFTDQERPTAIFASNNRATIGALTALSSLSINPAIVGFDDFELADLVGITVIAHDAVEMGRIAARLALQTSSTRLSPGSTVVIPTSLIQRGSGERRPNEF